MSPRPLLEVDQLAVELPVEGEMRSVLHEVSFTLDSGESLGLVGESGSGKSMTARAIDRLLPRGARVSGRIDFDGTGVLGLTGRALREYRAHSVAMIFQDPRAHINPVRTIGDFMVEPLVLIDRVPGSAARKRAVELLDSVGISEPEHRLRQFPHELSGGMLQRVMIASALAVRPRLIIADEPTTAIDVTTQSEVMAILDGLRREHGTAMVFITHDLDLASAVCDRTGVMYAGSVVECQPSSRLHDDPLHPYTAALVRARPSIAGAVDRLHTIPGQPLSAFETPSGCAFAPRCDFAHDWCRETEQVLQQLDTGVSRCGRIEEVRGRLLAAPSDGASTW